MGKKVWHDTNWFEDTTGDGYADRDISTQYTTLRDLPGDTYRQNYSIMQAINIDPSYFGHSKSSGLTTDAIREQYRQGLSDLTNLYTSNQINIDQYLAGQNELASMKSDAEAERRRDLEYKDEWTEEELENLVEEYGLEQAEQISGRDIDGSGDISGTGMSQKDYGRQRQYDRDMADYGDDNNDKIPDYPSATNQYGETYGYKDGEPIYDRDASGNIQRPESRTSDTVDQWYKNLENPNVKEWEQTPGGKVST